MWLVVYLFWYAIYDYYPPPSRITIFTSFKTILSLSEKKNRQTDKDSYDGAGIHSLR